MKRRLTSDEGGYLIKIIEFYEKYGPAEEVVNYYPGSYPNNPEKAIVKADKGMIRSIKDALLGYPEDTHAKEAVHPRLQPEEDYYAEIKVFLEGEYEDKWDILALISALSRYQADLARELRESEQNDHA